MSIFISFSRCCGTIEKRECCGRRTGDKDSTVSCDGDNWSWLIAGGIAAMVVLVLSLCLYGFCRSHVQKQKEDVYALEQVPPVTYGVTSVPPPQDYASPLAAPQDGYGMPRFAPPATLPPLLPRGSYPVQPNSYSGQAANYQAQQYTPSAPVGYTYSPR